MKKILPFLAFVAAILIPVHASAQISLPLKWNRSASSKGLGVADSLVISIPGAAAAADFADTTEWVDLGDYQLAPQAYSAQPLVTFQINGQATATTDSIGYAVQTTDNKDTPPGSGASVNSGYTSATVAYLTTVASTTAGSNLIGRVVAVAPTVSVYVPRYARLVVLNSDTSGSIGRKYFSVAATIWGVKRPR